MIGDSREFFSIILQAAPAAPHGACWVQEADSMRDSAWRSHMPPASPARILRDTIVR